MNHTIHLTAKRLTLGLGALALLASPARAQDGDVLTLETFNITAATRTERSTAALPVTTTVVSEAALRDQLAISSDLGSALAQTIPSYAPSRQKMTSRGESFRGRDPLYLIDGIPQSNPLRAGNRESLTIDPFFLDRVEAVHGSSAAQGMGATGGIINFVTLRAPEVDGMRQTLEIAGSTSTRLKSDGIGGRLAYAMTTREGPVSLAAGATFQRHPMAYDGDGRALGVDNVQGDLLDSDSYDLFFRAETKLGPGRSVGVMLNHFNLEQNLDWVNVPGDRATGLPTTSIEGVSRGRPAENKVTSASFSFADSNFLNGSLTADVFLQDFGATYGASDTASTRNNFRVDGVPTLDQSRIEAEKRGLRTTWARTFENYGSLGVVTGFDYLEDETRQVLVLTGRTWVPDTTYTGWSPYLQLEKPFGSVTLHGGVRYEDAKLEVPDFTTIESAGSAFVTGGSPSFDKFLVNLGGAWRATETVTVFGGFTQGFGMPDVGRVLRGINVDGTSVDDFIDLQPVVTDNWETGVRLRGRNWRAGVSGFYSTSDLGSRLVADAAGIFSVARERTEVYGVELTGDLTLGEIGRFGGFVALIEGKSDRDGDGRIDHRLPAANITAPKLALHWDRNWGNGIRTRLQSLTLFDRDDPDHIAAGDFSGYTLIDALVTLPLARGEVTVAVENLFDDDAIIYYSQTLTGAQASDDNLYAVRGRTLSVRYRFSF